MVWFHWFRVEFGEEEKTSAREFLKDDQNCTSSKTECNSTYLKNIRVYVFSNRNRNHRLLYSAVRREKNYTLW